MFWMGGVRVDTRMDEHTRTTCQVRLGAEGQHKSDREGQKAAGAEVPGATCKPEDGDYSERRAWMTSTRAARDAGSIEAITAAASSTNADRITGKAPGIFKSPK